MSSSPSPAKKQKTDDGDAPILYSYFRSGSSWRCRIALEFKGMKYDYKGINLLKAENYGEEYSKINTLQVLPAIIMDGVTICQSPAILEYLEETRPEPSYMPKDAILRAKVREICMMIGCDIHPVQNLRVMKRVRAGLRTRCLR
jgi:maleylacetoacetate isomerase